MSSSTPCSDLPLPFEALEDRLDELLDPVLSSRRTASPLARGLARIGRSGQDFTLHWAEVVSKSSSELAYQFVILAPQALEQLDHAAVEAWVIGALDAFDREGLYVASAVLKDLEGRAARQQDSAAAVRLADVLPVLELFLQGLAGRQLRIEPGDAVRTDTETVYLPQEIGLFPAREPNLKVYRAAIVLLWAQSRFGTYALPAERYPAHAAGLQRLAFLEALRLGARIATLLPGMARQMADLREAALCCDMHQLAPLADPCATVEDSLRLLKALPEGWQCPDWPYVGMIDPAGAAQVREARLARERGRMRSLLARLDARRPGASGRPPEARAEFRLERADATHGSADGAFHLFHDGQPVEPPAELAGLAESIWQDLGEIPPDYLVPAGPGAYRAETHSGMPDEPAEESRSDDGALLYDEWDHDRRHYRKAWCQVFERQVHAASPAFVDRTLRRYAGQVWQLRRAFEALRGEDRRLKREPHGDDVDLDALVEAYGDLTQGLELPQRLFTLRRNTDRNLAALFMVDMSGSTKGWINDAEREALVMLCEALEALGDRYAIYGFSGMSRKRCEVYRVKRFDEPYGDEVKARIAGITPLDYTRMGAAIRHLTGILDRVEARTKLLVTLSDGKPDDFHDGYRGEYGIQDTRHALLEAKRLGIRPFCITIDSEAREYLPRMYGEVNWVLVDEVARLPVKVVEIYRRLTR